MYRVPKELDLSPIIGECTSQLRVGQFDLQFTLGTISFAIQSPVSLYRNDELIGQWCEGRWPDPEFYDVLNTEVAKYLIEDERRIVIEFKNGIQMHLEDNSDQYESMQISFQDPPEQIIL
jgi:hypothetical protein